MAYRGWGPLERISGVRAMQLRVYPLGELVVAASFSPHDCWYRSATPAAQAGTPITGLNDAESWAYFHTPSRYVEQAKVANEGVRLSRPPQPVSEDHGEDGA